MRRLSCPMEGPRVCFTRQRGRLCAAKAKGAQRTTALSRPAIRHSLYALLAPNGDSNNSHISLYRLVPVLSRTARDTCLSLGAALRRAAWRHSKRRGHPSFCAMRRSCSCVESACIRAGKRARSHTASPFASSSDFWLMCVVRRADRRVVMRAGCYGSDDCNVVSCFVWGRACGEKVSET